MAAIGMKHLVGAPWDAQQTEGQLPKYGTGMKIGRAISSNITFKRNESELYADDVLADAVSKVFDFRPAAIIEALDLRRPQYRALAAYGHIGREDLGVAWEKTDRVEALKQAVGA